MADLSSPQKLSIEILSDPSGACLNMNLDLLELEDGSLSQLHPLAQVIALSERGRGSSISKKMLQDAAKTIILSGSCGICTEDDGDPDPTYLVRQLGKGSISSGFCFDHIYMEEIRVELQLVFEMDGETLDSDAVAVEAEDRISMTLKDLPLAASMINTFEQDRKWLDIFLSNQSKISVTSPGSIYLCGYVDISLEAVRLVMNDHELATLRQPNIPIARLGYSQGELTDSQCLIPIEESSEFGSRCFWPVWLPDVAREATLQATEFYRTKLASETDESLIEEINDALLSVGELITHESDELYLELEDLLDISNLCAPGFRDVCFSLSRTKQLPSGFVAERDLGLACLHDLLAKLSDIYNTL